MTQKNRMVLFILALFINVEVFGVIRILTFHYNQPEFIEMQYKTLKKFCLDDFELIVFSDAKTADNEKGIADTCARYGIQCIRFIQENHLTDPLNGYLKSCLADPSIISCWGWNESTSLEEIARNPSVRHSHVIQYALNYFGYDHDDIVVIMDGDNFLIKELSIRELLGSYDIVGFNQKSDSSGDNRRRFQMSVPKNQEMLWVVFMAFNPSKLPNPQELQLHVDIIKNHPAFPKNSLNDTGAAIYKYLEKYPDLNVQAYYWQSSGVFREGFTSKELKKLGFEKPLIRFIKDLSPGNVQFFIFEHFMHFSAVSAEVAYHDHKVCQLRRFIEATLREK